MAIADDHSKLRLGDVVILLISDDCNGACPDAFQAFLDRPLVMLTQISLITTWPSDLPSVDRQAIWHHLVLFA